jgi:hypothetical protein
MQPDYKFLTEKTGIEFPLIGFYDTPETKDFEPFQKAHACVFAYFKQWEKGKAVVLSKEQFGCPGAGKWLCNISTRSKEDFIQFLAEEEGLKASHELMGQWLDYEHPYQQKHEYLVFSPLVSHQYKYLQTVTFFVNPDQLSILSIGAQLYHSPGEPEPVIAPFGSGCMQLVSLFKDLTIPQAIIGATDMAMRKYLPPDILAFTVTKKMFEQLCALDETSYLEKRFLKDFKKARNRS